MFENIKMLREHTLKNFTIGELENRITAESVAERLENIDNLWRLWFSFFIKSNFK